MELRLMLWRARHAPGNWLRSWASRYSGYAAHLEEEHPLAGWLQIGEVRCRISSVAFTGGHRMEIRAVAGPVTRGAVRGYPVLLDTDGVAVLSSPERRDYGMKPAGSTWTVRYTVLLPGARP